MAVTVTDNRTTFDQADATTGWIPSGDVSVFTSEPTPKELTGCIGVQVSNESVQCGHEDLLSVSIGTNNLIYIWALPQGIMDTAANFGVAAFISDGVDKIGYKAAGADVAAFRHNDGQPGWQCIVLDSASLPSSFIEYSGREADLTWAGIQVIGIGFKTLVKSVGGVENCFVDIIRYGTGGITVIGGTSGDPGTFSEVAAEDSSNASVKAYGIIHELASGLFGVQGKILFGDTAGSTLSYFKDSEVTVVFEDRGLDTSRYGLEIQGNSTLDATFWLTNSTLICPAGVGAYFKATDADLAVLTLDNVILSGFDQGVDFANSAAAGIDHDVTNCTFTGCAMIDPGDVSFEDNVISSSTDADGSFLLDSDGTGHWKNLHFVSDGTGHAIYITATGTYTFDNLTFSSGFTGTSTNAAIYNNSGGVVTINVTNGGDTPSVRNGSGASTTVNNAKTVIVTVKSATTGALVSGARVYLLADAGGPMAEGTEILNGVTDALGFVNDIAFNYKGDQPVTGRVRKGSSTPLYKTGGLGGTITDTGYDVVTFLVDDE